MSSSTQWENDMLDRLVKIINNCLNVESVIEHIDSCFMDFATDTNFLKYFHSNWVAGHKLCKFTYDSFFSLILFFVNIFLGPTLIFLLGM